MSGIRVGVAVAAVTLALPAGALAGGYPPPGNPGAVQKAPKGPFHTFTVCKKGCKYKTIQSAVNQAKAGTRSRSRPGRTARP